MTPLCELSRKHGCDKGGEYHPYGDVNRWSHCYTPVYNAFFATPSQQADPFAGDRRERGVQHQHVA